MTTFSSVNNLPNSGVPLAQWSVSAVRGKLIPIWLPVLNDTDNILTTYSINAETPLPLPPAFPFLPVLNDTDNILTQYFAANGRPSINILIPVLNDTDNVLTIYSVSGETPIPLPTPGIGYIPVKPLPGITIGGSGTFGTPL